ncbi:hypothetical protein [Vibrio phage vB_VhaS-a]|nr:hypothetical protein [Vibrio phage vB_VhaS-a]
MADLYNKELVKLRFHLRDLDGSRTLGGNIEKVEVEIPASLQVERDEVRLAVCTGDRHDAPMIAARGHTIAEALNELTPKLGFETLVKT